MTLLKKTELKSVVDNNSTDGPNRVISEEASKESKADSEESSYSNTSSSEESSESEEEEIDPLISGKNLVASEFLDNLITRLMNAEVKPDIQPKTSSNKKAVEFADIVPVKLEFEELDKLCEMAIQSFMKQSSLLVIDKLQFPLTIVGDCHGQFKDLRNIFYRCGAPNKQTYLFLGDYVDRGVQGIEVLALLLALKIKYPTRVYMIRGNHEDANTCSSYGFYEECINRFTDSNNNTSKGESIWRKFINVFDVIPLAALVCKSIFCVHGGLSPSLLNNNLDIIAKIKRPSIIPPHGLMCDILWSDPTDNSTGWGMNARGISLTFGPSIVEQFCQRFKIDLVVRGHQLTRQMVPNGYRFFANGRLLTLFSAANYLNLKNSAAVLRVNKKMKCRFIVFKLYKSQQKT